MQTRYLETLVTALENGSFSRAAELLHITQSAVSQRIKFLEEQFGHQLIDRSGPVLAPTAAGRMVLTRSQEILALEARLRDDLKHLGESKRLSLCCTPTFGMAFLPAVLDDFMRRNTDLDNFKFIFQQPEEALRGLQDQRYDLAVVEHCADLDLGGFEHCPLADDELVFVSAPLLGLPTPDLPLEALLEQRIYARRDGCSSKELLRRNLAAHGRTLENFRSVIISDDLQLTLQSVLGGAGTSFMSRNLVDSHLQAGTLRRHSVPGFEQRRRRSVVRLRRQGASPLTQDFLASLATILAQRGEDGLPPGCMSLGRTS